MKIETYEQRILTPDTGYWLYNADARVISEKVYLGKEASTLGWIEITQEEKETLEAQWKAEIDEE